VIAIETDLGSSHFKLKHLVPIELLLTMEVLKVLAHI